VSSIPPGLVCPRCKKSLGLKGDKLVCSFCREDWPMIHGVPAFCRFEDAMEDLVAWPVEGSLGESAEVLGWRAALFELTRERIKKGMPPIEDQRSADWRFTLPIKEDSVVLVIGSGFGTVPVELARSCATVIAMDSDVDRARYLQARIVQEAIPNLHVVLSDGSVGFPFVADFFDLVAFTSALHGEMLRVPCQEMVRDLSTLLKAGGIAYLNFRNKWAFQRFLGRRMGGTGLTLHSLFGYQQMLEAEGLDTCTVVAPLPSQEGVPLFVLPLDHSGPMKFFLRSLFPLFDMASPEVKRGYGLEYLVARIGVRVALLFRLWHLAKFFVPGFSITAVKREEGWEEGHAE